jgi:hypothetical protein
MILYTRGINIAQIDKMSTVSQIAFTMVLVFQHGLVLCIQRLLVNAMIYCVNTVIHGIHARFPDEEADAQPTLHLVLKPRPIPMIPVNNQ